MNAVAETDAVAQASGPRPVYRAEQLRRMLEPTSIAVVGASGTPGTIGNQALNCLADFPGDVYPVNPKYPEINGFKAYPDLASLPKSPDCVIIATPRSTVLSMIEASAKVGAGGIVIFASGFGEVEDEGHRAAQDRIAEAALRHGIPILGPNCIGYANVARRTFATFVAMTPRPAVTERAIGVVSQSGALGFALAQAAVRGVSFSHVLAAGNACDIDPADFVSYLAGTDECRAIICLVEGMQYPARMVDAARLARQAGKPLVLCATGRTAEGAAAARAHTGSLAGTLTPWREALLREGAVIVDDYGRLVETAAFLTKVPVHPVLPAVGAVATSGGSAIFIADAASENGVAMPQPSGELTERLRPFIPDFVTIRNPCDITAQGGPDAFQSCVKAFVESGEYGALIVPQAASWRGAEERLALLGEMVGGLPVPLCVVWLSEDIGGQSTHVIEQGDMNLFRSMDRCLAAIALWHARSAALRRYENEGA